MRLHPMNCLKHRQFADEGRGDFDARSRQPCGRPSTEQERFDRQETQTLAQYTVCWLTYAVEQVRYKQVESMTLAERLRQIVVALPSPDSSVMLTRAVLANMLEEGTGQPSIDEHGDLTVEQVAAQTNRAPSTIRGWLIDGDLRGYKLNERDWRVTRAALREYLDERESKPEEPANEGQPVDISAWRRVR